MAAMLVLTLDSCKLSRKTYYVRMLITFPRFLISTLEFRRELGLIDGIVSYRVNPYPAKLKLLMIITPTEF